MTLIDMAFAKRSTRVSEAATGRKLYEHFKEVSRAAGARKPSESQKVKALWAMKAAKDREEECYDPERKDNIVGRNKNAIGTVGRVPQRPKCGTGQSFEVRGESVSRLSVGSRLL